MKYEMTAKQKGNFTELRCIAACIENGCTVSIPYGENCKYDFIIDIEGLLVKVQAKTASLKATTIPAIEFYCKCNHRNATGITYTTYTPEDIDYFATFWKDKAYLIPASECSTKKSLRLEKPEDYKPQNAIINFAEDYELGKQIEKIRKENKK